MKTRLSLLLSAILGLTIVTLLALLSLRHDRQIDWTDGQRNTLTNSSRQLLDSLPAPISATAYVFPNPDVRRDISARFAPYLRARPDFSLQFIDPASDPAQVRELGIAQSGEVVLEYQGRRENLSTLSEPEISAALQRLSFADQARIVFISGHGERDPLDQAQAGFSALADILGAKGLQLSRHSLATQALPERVDLLVLAAPRQGLLAGELQRLQTYLAEGGNLLWLTDPGLPAIPELSSVLALQALQGTLIYQDYELLGTGHPALALVAQYPKHPVTGALTDLSAFPVTAGLALSPGSDWHAAPILRSVERAWLETGALEGQLQFDEERDIRGPITFGMALERSTTQPSRPNQRVAVIADSDFLANAYLSQLGNRALGVALFQWLVQRDAQINVDLPAAPDHQLQLSPLATRLIAALFIAGLPLGLFAAGLTRWWLRRARR